MPFLRITTAPHPLPSELLEQIVALYNCSLNEMYGFFPITADRFQTRICDFPAYRPDLLFLAFAEERLVGMLHAGIIRQRGYDPSATVEVVCVDPVFRGRGIAGRLVDVALGRLVHERGLYYIDGGGAFPDTPFYTTLLSGSERSGLELDNTAAIKLFERHGFLRGRESIIMRANLQEELPPLSRAYLNMLEHCDRVELVRDSNATWFDQVFRGWRLTESRMVTPSIHEPVTRAVYVPMDDLSVIRGRKTYALFAVNTSMAARGHGWASLHLRILRKALLAQGAEDLELHVYSDNIPAVRLYTKSGFREVKRTAMFHFMLRP